jgi:hypothetical protein
MDHQLENLGPDRFQQLVQALLVSEHTDVTCFPISQRDGGRDAIQNHVVDDSVERNFYVYQVKYARVPSKIDDVVSWILDKMDGEREKIHELVRRGAKRYVLITNVPGTGHLDAGTMDKTTARLESELKIQIQIWWRDDINRRLEGNWDIKLRYSEVLSGHDFFSTAVGNGIWARKRKTHERPSGFFGRTICRRHGGEVQAG